MLKKVFLLIVIVTMLIACNNNKEDVKNKIFYKHVNQASQTENKQHIPQENQQEESKQIHSKESTTDDQWTSLLEYQTIVMQIDKKGYTFQTVVDNAEKRILLLRDDDGIEQYKTIFIKKTKRLKIIKLTGEGEIFNDILKV